MFINKKSPKNKDFLCKSNYFNVLTELEARACFRAASTTIVRQMMILSDRRCRPMWDALIAGAGKKKILILTGCIHTRSRPSKKNTSTCVSSVRKWSALEHL